MPGPVGALAVLGQAAGAIQNFVNEIRRLPDAVRSFVDSFNPAAGQRLDYALKSLNATIGGAVEPIILQATAIVERFADSIAGGLDRLRAPIEKVTGLFTAALAPAMASAGVIFDGLASAGELLMPLMQPLAGMFEAALALGHILTTVGVEVLLETIRQLVPDAKTLEEMTASVIERFGELAASTIHLADFFLSLAGKQDVLLRVLDSIIAGPSQGQRRAPAASNFTMGSMDEVYRARLMSAAKGGGKSPEEKNLDLMTTLVRVATEIKDELKNNPKAAQEKASEAVSDFTIANMEASIGLPFWRRAWDRVTGSERQNQRNGR